MTSRERMLAAIRGETPDYVPMAFMIFNALRAERDDWEGRLDAQLALGLDAVADLTFLSRDRRDDNPDLPGLPIRFPAGLIEREWKQTPAGAPYPVLHKDYETPKGTLSIAVDLTDDWPHGEHMPFFSDFVEPRCRKYLVAGEADLEPLRWLLADPHPDDVKECRTRWRHAQTVAKKKGLLVAAGWGVGGDALGWLCGLDQAVMWAMDQPELLAAVLGIVEQFNRKRMAVMLEAKPDLFLRRGWYEGTAYWSPTLFRQFLLPALRREAEMAHQAGVAFGFILTQGPLQFADELAAAGIDLLIGPDPIQDRDMDLAALRRRVNGRFAVWGGVNGFVTVERGTKKEIRQAVRQALKALGPDRLILSPVDNIRDHSDAVWQNVLALIAAWQEMR